MYTVYLTCKINKYNDKTISNGNGCTIWMWQFVHR